MTIPEPYRVAVRRPDGVHYYVLTSKEITLPGGVKQTIRFFAREDAPPTGLDDELVVVEMPRSQLPLEHQIIVARALVDRLGYSPADAAILAGQLKAKVEGLGQDQTQELVQQIEAALGE